jgi:hypothetical protein
MSICLQALLISAVLINPASLVGEKTYIRDIADRVVIETNWIVIELTDLNYYGGLDFLISEKYGRQARFVNAWIQKNCEKRSIGNRDYEKIEIETDDGTLAIERRADSVTLMIGRSYGSTTPHLTP